MRVRNSRERHPSPLVALGIAQAVFILNCGGDDGVGCPEGEIRVDGSCTTYEPSDPAPSEGVWKPVPGTTWQWQLTGDLDTSMDVEMYDVDLFNVTDEELASLSDKTVICYFSAGTWEEWRPDAHLFPEESLGKTMEEWDDERWLDVTNSSVRSIMIARLNRAVDRGCDGVEPDNMDGYANENGVHLNATEQLEYNRWIADQAHERGLSVGLKNDLDQVEDLFEWFDWALNEECYAYDECNVLTPFLGAGKAVFHVEYVDDWADATELASEVCDSYGDFSTLIKTWDLGEEFLACG